MMMMMVVVVGDDGGSRGSATQHMMPKTMHFELMMIAHVEVANGVKVTGFILRWFPPYICSINEPCCTERIMWSNLFNFAAAEAGV